MAKTAAKTPKSCMGGQGCSASIEPSHHMMKQTGYTPFAGKKVKKSKKGM